MIQFASRFGYAIRQLFAFSQRSRQIEAEPERRQIARPTYLRTPIKDMRDSPYVFINSRIRTRKSQTSARFARFPCSFHLRVHLINLRDECQRRREEKTW